MSISSSSEAQMESERSTSESMSSAESTSTRSDSRHSLSSNWEPNGWEDPNDWECNQWDFLEEISSDFDYESLVTIDSTTFETCQESSIASSTSESVLNLIPDSDASDYSTWSLCTDPLVESINMFKANF